MKQTKIAVSKLRPFENNPYQVRDDAEMNTLIESIQMQGVLSPLIVRPICKSKLQAAHFLRKICRINMIDLLRDFFKVITKQSAGNVFDVFP